MKKVVKWISNTISVMLLASLIIMLFTVISSKASGGEPKFFGHQLKIVLSGSMEPSIQTGSVIVVKPEKETEKYKEGDIITFQADENVFVTHRIIKVVKNGNEVMYQTKGDNNEEADSELVLSKNVVAKYTGITIPYIGYFMNFVNSKQGSVILLIIPGIILFSYSLISIFRALAEIDKNLKQSTAKEDFNHSQNQ
ncbi:signal peptidase I [Aeribacillus composti]|uniref:signal peptidase I SipW n=1 Tax=Aeribacillus composti TaxID=1868734 RepID=UPI002E1CCA66|nr:signal peptidase I [Aeribacillus composti]